MIANVIVLAALVLAGLYVALWLRNGELRRRIEEPKQIFQRQVADHDERVTAGQPVKRGRD